MPGRTVADSQAPGNIGTVSPITGYASEMSYFLESSTGIKRIRALTPFLVKRLYFST